MASSKPRKMALSPRLPQVWLPRISNFIFLINLVPGEVMLLFLLPEPKTTIHPARKSIFIFSLRQN